MTFLPRVRRSHGVALIDAGVLALASLAAFWPVLRNGFVNWDDPEVLVGNARLDGPGVVIWAFSTTHIGHYQPLAWLAWSAVKSRFGASPPAFHALSLAGHLVNGWLAYGVTLALVARSPLRPRQRRAAALVAAGAFLLHPVQVEAVAWASAFPYVLSLAALLLALLAYLHGRPIASIACYAASLLARANALAFPAVLLLVDLYPLERQRRLSLGRLALEKIPFAALATAAAIAESRARDLASLAEIGVGARLTMAAAAPFRYVGRVLWPAHLSPLDPLPISPALDLIPLVLGTAGLVALGVAAWTLRRRWPLLGAGSIAYVVMLAPAAGLTPSGLQATADRYWYAPGLVVSLAIGVAAGRLLVPGRRGRVVKAAAAAIFATLGALTWHQTRYWHDSIALWTRAAEIDPRDDIATYNLAIALAEAGREDEAASRYEQTLRLVPGHDLARRNLAILQAARAEREADRLAAAGRVDEAAERYARALALDAGRLHARAARGMLLARRGQFREAASELGAAFDGGVKDAEVPNMLAFALLQTGDGARAAAVLTRAVAGHPEAVTLKHNLARLLATSADPHVRDGARALDLALDVCERTGYGDPRALDTLAAAYAASGRLDRARATASRAAARARELGDVDTAAELAARARGYRR